jgi:hypothetical protein
MLSSIFRQETPYYDGAIPTNFEPRKVARGSYLPVTASGQEQLMLSTGPLQQDGPFAQVQREGTAELTNDPRFFTENVLDKRLAAFEALAIVTELMSSEALKQCFELGKEYMFRLDLPLIAAMQLIGFLLMCTVMFMSTVATAVLSLQLFFTIRLMTAGPTGFDKAARFYADRRMWVWRERAIFGVKYSLSCFTLSTGFMLFVKIFTEGLEGGGHSEHHESSKLPSTHPAAVATIVFLVFLGFASGIWCLVREHQRIFDESYISVDTCVPGELRTHFLSNRAGP